uniref:Rho-GAP domain-containing protein n=1 Tax=Neogobius melanostomus TaxID=47308 RepID=A0A8C6TWP4_9GOBI
ISFFLQHNKAAVKVREDMLKMVHIPVLKPRGTVNNQPRVFGKCLRDLQEQGLLKDGVPLVVKRMVEHIRSHGLDQEGLFRVNGNVRAVDSLKQRLESGEDMDLVSECDVSTVASLLKLYLRELPQALIGSTVQKALIQHYQDCRDSGSCSDISDLLQLLPDVHLSLLRYLCQFLTQVEHNHKVNRMTAHNLATVFGPSIFQ